MTALLSTFDLTPLPPHALAFRAEVRAFLDEHLPALPPEIRARSWMGFDAAFSRALAARGWVGITLPAQYGGAGLDPYSRFVLVEELLARGAPVSAPTLGLISGGNITQAAGASITAGTLLAQSFGGNVILNDPGNKVSADTLGGGAAGRFEFVNSGPLKIGPVSVIAYDSSGNQPQVQAADSMAADTLLVRTLSGELILDTAVNTTGGADLVAATTFQNTGRGTLGGAPWRVWADTWVGESRGGLVGSGQLPNLYHCAYLGVCTVTVSPGDNHFIYAQQPSLTVNIGSFARQVGQPNPRFTYTLAGLLTRGNGDVFSLAVRRVEVNRNGGGHAISNVPVDLDNVELRYSRGMGAGKLSIGVGYQSPATSVGSDSRVHGFASWQQGF